MSTSLLCRLYTMFTYNGSKVQIDLARKDWFYIPLPVEQAKALDDIIKKEGLKYGITDRTEFIRRIVGEFIERYERSGKSFLDAKKSLQENNNNSNTLTLSI